MTAATFHHPRKPHHYFLLLHHHLNSHRMLRRRLMILTTLPFFTILLFIFLVILRIHVCSPLAHQPSPNKEPKFASPPPTKPLIITQTPQLTLLIGILTRPETYDRRHLLRLVYGVQPSSSPSFRIDVKFVLCRLTSEDQRLAVALEIMRFDDILLLNCSENMNGGKTFTYFSSLPAMLPRRYDYVMKADDDVFIRLGRLAASLQPLPRSDLYYGYVIPCGSSDPFVKYMSGMGFVLSWDLVEWMASSEVPVGDRVGPEDKMVGKWLDKGRKARNRVSEKPGMYDYPGTNGKCSHELIPETVAVHRLKRWDQWMHVLSFFNVTRQLNLSEMYNL